MEIRAAVETEDQLDAVLLNSTVALVYVDEAGFPDAALPGLVRRIWDAGKKAGLRFRRIYRGNQEGMSPAALLSYLRASGVMPEALLLRTLDEVGEVIREEAAGAALSEAGMPAVAAAETMSEKTTTVGRSDTSGALGKACRPELVFDYTLYAYNRAASSVLLSLGADRICYPVELSLPELLAVRGRYPQPDPRYELMVYGRIPMMVSANCLAKTTRGCDHGNRILRMKDRRGKALPCRCYCKYCYNQIFNAEPCVLYDLPREIGKIKPDSLRYDFSVESGRETEAILAGKLPEGGGFTRGHFRQKME